MDWILAANAMSAVSPALLAVLFGLAAVGFNWLVHRSASQSKAMVKRPQRTDRFNAGTPPEVLFKDLPEHEAFDAFQYYGTDEGRQTIVFGTKHSLWSNGFYHRIRIRTNDQGGSSLTVETMSKSYQVGPVVSRVHKTFAQVVREAAGQM